MKTAMKTTTLYVIGMAALLLSACVKDRLYRTPHPGLGKIIVTTDWSLRGGGVDIPPTYMLRIGAGEQETSRATTYFGDLVPPGEHNMLVYNRPAGIAIDDATASVEPVETASDQPAAGGIEPQPDYLFASFQEISVLPDDTLRVVATMNQYVRQLGLELTVSSGDYNRVSSAVATLEGVETAIDLTTGVRSGTPASTSTAFTQEGNRFSLYFRLLGIVPSEKQKLTVSIAFDNGDMMTVDSDLSSQLSGFNDGTDPMKLDGELLLPVGGGISGSTIENWTEAGGGNVDAG